MQKKSSLSLIVATTLNNVIGKDNRMPWHLPADLAWFKQNTTQKPIVMGRKTFESIGRALPNRTNVVLSRRPFQHPDVIWQPSMEAAIEYLQNFPEIMLIGGGQLFKQYLPQADKIYLTEIQTNLEGDTFFPEIEQNNWEQTFEQLRRKDDQNAYDCKFMILERKK